MDTIYKIRQSITYVSHSETYEDLEFQNLVDFQEVDPTFFEFLETQAGDSRPPKPLDTYPPLASIPSP